MGKPVSIFRMSGSREWADMLRDRTIIHTQIFLVFCFILAFSNNSIPMECNIRNNLRIQGSLKCVRISTPTDIHLQAPGPEIANRDLYKYFAISYVYLNSIQVKRRIHFYAIIPLLIRNNCFSTIYRHIKLIARNISDASKLQVGLH